MVQEERKRGRGIQIRRKIIALKQIVHYKSASALFAGVSPCINQIHDLIRNVYEYTLFQKKIIP